MDHTLIIGLGNPDREFENTYHNVGALAVEWLARRSAERAALGDTEGGSTPRFRPYKGLFSYVKIGGLTFVRPLVYMNESGHAVAEAMRTQGFGTKDIVIVHDDSDIPVGEFKRARGGGAAGHKGVRSVIDHLRTEDFARIRIGIREQDESHRKKAGDFVLSPITAADKETFEKVFEKIERSVR